jgi:hypothetical protein
LRFRSSICAWRAAMNLRIAGRKQPWKSRHFNQTRFDFLIVALAGVFIAGKVMQTKGLTEKKAARKLRLGAGTEAEEKPARLVSVMAGRLVLSLPSATFRFRGEVFASVRENLESNSFAVDLLGSLGFARRRHEVEPPAAPGSTEKIGDGGQGRVHVCAGKRGFNCHEECNEQGDTPRGCGVPSRACC